MKIFAGKKYIEFVTKLLFGIIFNYMFIGRYLEKGFFTPSNTSLYLRI